jgi:16S rRNA (guanine527-N7)-methyltransferase
MKGSSAQEEVDASGRELRAHGAGTVEVLVCGGGVVDPPTTVVRVEATRPSRLRLAATQATRASRAGAKKKSGKKGRSA